MRLMWCTLIGLLALITNVYGSDCSPSTLLKVQQTHWTRCNAENHPRLQELSAKELTRDEGIRQACCIISDIFTCVVDSVRSECGNEAASDTIKNLKFKDDCSSWKYPDSISQCQLWYTTWWFIMVVVTLVIVVIAAVVFCGLRKRIGKLF